MDWYYKAILTTCAVAIVLLAARKLGGRFAGVLAGMPFISAPALVCVASSAGEGAGAHAAIASVAASAMLAAFALGYERSARSAGPLTAVLVASLSAALMAALSSQLVSGVGSALAVALLACAGALRALPHLSGAQGTAAPPHAQVAASAALAGGVSAGVTLMLPLLGAFGAGLLASVPIVGGTAMVLEHKRGDRRALVCFLRGYVAGLPSKAVFGAVFATLLGECELLPSLIGATAACLISALVGSGAGTVYQRLTASRAVVHLSPARYRPTFTR
jgi:hypothetical protein